MEKLSLRLEFRRRSCRSIPRFVVPGADVLADVATKNMMAERRPQLLRDAAAFFNGEISDAAARIELAGSDKRLRRTRIEAARTASASVRSREIGRQLQRCQD